MVPLMSETAVERLSRLLALVPWLIAHQGIEISRVATEFNVSQDQLIKDLELLFVCGLPGHLPDDLIEADWESGYVFLGNAEVIARPLRLGVDESVALISGLRTLAEIPGVGERSAVRRALAKLTDAAGEAAHPAAQLTVDLTFGQPKNWLEKTQLALAENRRIALGYLSPASEEPTHREVDPMNLHHFAGNWYLEGWCHQAESVRVFRLDRVTELQVLQVPGTPPAHAQARDLTESMFTPSPTDELVELELRPGGFWVSDHYPVIHTEQVTPERRRITLRTAQRGWVKSLVLSLGGQATVIHPTGLAAEISQLAAAALAGYDTLNSD